MICLRRPYTFKFFKGCLPQILVAPFLDALAHMIKNTISTFFGKVELQLVNLLYLILCILIKRNLQFRTILVQFYAVQFYENFESNPKPVSHCIISSVSMSSQNTSSKTTATINI